MSDSISSKNFWLNIDKPYGYSSAKIVAIVKKLTGARKVGHAGTLDPLATGVLPIAINQATKTCQYITDSDKKYYFKISWGEFRDTDDLEGKVIKSDNKRPKTSDIIATLPNFIGQIEQIPPQFSAIKVNGKKAYQIARNNGYIDLKPRQIKIYDIKLISNSNINAEFEIACSKGTYIRSFARDLALKLGCCGYICALRRLKVGNFTIKNIISLDKLKNIVKYDYPNGLCSDFYLNLRDVLSFMPEIEFNYIDALKIKNGQIIKVNKSLLQKSSKLIVKIIYGHDIIGLGRLESDHLKPVNIFNN